MMGSSPNTKVSATRIFTSGRSTPNRRSTTSRYSQVKKVLITEIQNCANTTRWNDEAMRAACRAISSVSGRRCGCVDAFCMESSAPITMPNRMCASERPIPRPASCSEPAFDRSHSAMRACMLSASSGT